MANARDVTKRGWRYFWAKLFNLQNKHEDPKIQLEMALEQERQRRARVTDATASIMAQARGAERRLAELRENEAKQLSQVQTGIELVSKHRSEGNEAKAVELENASRNLANDLLATRAEIQSQEAIVLQAANTAEQARNAAQQFDAHFKQQVRESQQLLSQIDQTTLLTELSAATDAMDSALGGASSIGQVKARILQDADKAAAQAQLSTQFSGKAAAYEIEAAARDSSADKLLAELGLPPAQLSAGASAPVLEQGDKS